jgi:aconitate hydratase
VLAGKEYGSGSSRDWAAKGTTLLGIKAVIAESYERIHRSNLVGMGVLPLQYLPGQNAESLGITGQEEFSIVGIAEGLTVGQKFKVLVKSGEQSREIAVMSRLDSAVEIEYYTHGGILNYVLRNFLKD